MSDKPTQSSPAGVPGPETQHQRWMKYGANVVLASVVVVLLGIVLTAIAQQSWAKLNVDTFQDALAVAADAPGTRFANAVAALMLEPEEA